MSRCVYCALSECECINNLDYAKDEIINLETRLKEAEECLKFYANPGHWGTDLPGMSTAIDPVDQSAASYRGANYDIRGGKRAREYFKKWGVE